MRAIAGIHQQGTAANKAQASRLSQHFVRKMPLQGMICHHLRGGNGQGGKTPFLDALRQPQGDPVQQIIHLHVMVRVQGGGLRLEAFQHRTTQGNTHHNGPCIGALHPREQIRNLGGQPLQIGHAKESRPFPERLFLQLRLVFYCRHASPLPWSGKNDLGVHSHTGPVTSIPFYPMPPAQHSVATERLQPPSRSRPMCTTHASYGFLIGTTLTWRSGSDSIRNCTPRRQRLCWTAPPVRSTGMLRHPVTQAPAASP